MKLIKRNPNVNNQTQSKLFSFFNKPVSTHAGIAIIMVAFSVFGVKDLIFREKFVKVK